MSNFSVESIVTAKATGSLADGRQRPLVLAVDGESRAAVTVKLLNHAASSQQNIKEKCSSIGTSLVGRRIAAAAVLIIEEILDAVSH